MKNLILLSLSFILCTNAFAFGQKRPELNDLIQKSLNYIESEQYKTDQNLYTTGEWPVQMKSYFLPAILGVGRLFARPTDEPTLFATSSIMNILSETYILNPALDKIPALLKRGTTSFAPYKNDDVYSYYQWQEFRGVKVRGPLADGYVPDYLRGLTNIPTDADTTSVTYTSLAYLNKIENGSFHIDVPQGALDTFNLYRDIKRTPHYYNRLDSIKNSGAFMTWFLNEKDPAMPRGVFPKPDKGTRIPFGFNDVDCVVNANVLRMLTLTQNTDHPGFQDSCKLLNFSINENKQSQCGIYYPNSYAVFFSISNAYRAGAQCLESSRANAISFMVSTQKDDGSWDNEPGIGNTDTVQSTALALNALMNYTQNNREQYKSVIRAGVNYLIYQRSRKGDNQVYWKGEVFFSAVAQARNTVLWRSSAYTTALVTLALTKAQAYLDGEL